MEALLFLLNTLVLIVILFQGYRDDRRPPGQPQTGTFRYREAVLASDDAEAAEAAPAAPAPWEPPPWDPWGQGGQGRAR